MTNIELSGTATAKHGLDALMDLSAFGENPFRQTYDQETGVVIPADQSAFSFSDLKSAEAFLFLFASQEESLKIQQIRALLAIKNQGLFRQKYDENGEPFKSFEQYLKDLSKRLMAVDGAKPRSLKSWMMRVIVYANQLGMSDFDLLRLGYHGEIMLRCAARNRQGELTDQDEPTDTGGKRLGRDSFTALTKEISELVFAAQDDPSKMWSIKDTKERVNEILQKKDVEVSRTIDAEMVGDKIVIRRLTWWVDEIPYTVGDKIDKETFVHLAGNDEVRGLGDNWKESV